MSKDYPARSSRRQGRGERYAEGGWRRPEGPSYRLFIAVDIPSEATRRLVDWQREFLVGDRALRMVPEDQMHVTLVFLGRLKEKELGQASAQLDELGMPEPFEVTANGLVGLPKGRSPRVIAAGIEAPGEPLGKPDGRLKAIHDQLAAGLVAKRLYKRETRQFFPHVTIARARGRTRLDLSQIHTEPVKFTAVRITLYNSVLKQGGAVHQALKTVQLK